MNTTVVDTPLDAQKNEVAKNIAEDPYFLAFAVVVSVALNILGNMLETEDGQNLVLRICARGCALLQRLVPRQNPDDWAYRASIYLLNFWINAFRHRRRYRRRFIALFMAR